MRARVTQAVDMQNLITLRGNVHPLARPEFDQGVAPDDLPMERMLLVLQRGPDQEAALRQLLDDQQVKSSPRFHQWLTPEQFGQQFGPADSDIQAVTDWLASQGFEVTKVAAGRTVIEFSGTAGLVRQVLGTEIHKFTVNGEDRWANASDPQIPAALVPVVAGFASLNNFPRRPLTHRLGTFTRSKATGEVQPLFTFSPQANGYYFAVGPTDFATIYNVSPLWSAGTDGTGQTIAVVAEGDINLQDAADFRAMFGLPPNTTNIVLNGPDPGINDDESEADLDVQWSGAVARGATIDLVVSESTEATPGVDLSAVYIIDNNLAPILSASYGGCEADLGAGGNQFHSTLWEQAAAQGTTVLISSGDSGSATCDRGASSKMVALAGFSVNGLASTPFDVAVGGTDFADTSNPLTYWSLTDNSTYQSSALSYIPESPWNDTCAASGSLTGCANASGNTGFSEGIDLVAGGGGPSNCINSTGTYPNFTCSGGYPKPSWQSGTNVPQDGARDLPDLSLFAGNGFHYSFYVFCEMDANASSGGSSTSCDLKSPYTDFQGAGGTSISVQAFAGIMALVNQKYGRQGNANYVLYALAAQNPSGCNSSTTATTNSQCIFYDVTAGNNSVACAGGSPQCSDTTSGQYGLLVSGSPPTPAWTTTTGYDLATGLGSVNAANLVNKWTSNFTPSTTTLSLSTSPPTSPITLAHGQPINFTINVAPGSGSGTPTGDASLVAQSGNGPSNATGIGPFTLSGGAIFGSSVMLPGGQYNVTAHYAGNGTFGASDSSPGIPVTVAKESSQTEVRLVTPNAAGAPVYNVTTVPYGSVYILRMDVTNSSGQPCTNPSSELIAYPCPTGILTVTPAPTDQNPPKGTVAGSYVLNSEGYAEEQFIQLSPGTYDFMASYAGDSSYTASTSPVMPITITQAPTTASLNGTTLSQVETLYGVTILTTITTQSNGAAPTGTIQFLNGGTPIGNPTSILGTPYSASTGAYAKFQSTSTFPLPAGNDSVTVQYSGDSNYAGSTSPAITIAVTDFSVTANPSTITIPAPGQTGTSTLTLTPLNGFSGNVSVYAINCPTGGTCTISPSTVNLTGSSPVTTTFTVKTTAASSVVLPTLQRWSPPSLHLLVAWPWLLAGLLTLATALSLAVASRRKAGWVFAVLLLVAVIVAACGGGGGGVSNPSPPTAPILSLFETSVTFPSQTTGTTSNPFGVELGNSGDALLTISSVNITGANATDFAQTSECGSSMAPGVLCHIDVTFTPSAPGTRSAVLSISDNASGSPQTVSLSGTGVSPPPTPPGNYSLQMMAESGPDVHYFYVAVNVQ